MVENPLKTEDRDRWVTLIKTLRQTYDVDLFEAERLALSKPEWRRWVERQINSDRRCRRMALTHIRTHGPLALVIKDGDRLNIRGDA